MKESTERTEEEKVVQAGITVILGGQEYKIRPLVIKYSREWRKKSIPLISYLVKWSKTEEKDYEEAIEELFTTKTDEIVDSFFEFARDLKREEIEELATEGEVFTAFELLLAEWHITPDYIVNNWTDELLSLMCEKLSERKERELEAIKGRKNKTTSVDDLALKGKNLIKVVKKDGD